GSKLCDPPYRKIRRLLALEDTLINRPAVTFSRVVDIVGNAWRKAICRLRELRYASGAILRASACCCTAVAIALSISLSVPALRTTIWSPRRRAAASEC